MIERIGSNCDVAQMCGLTAIRQFSLESTSQLSDF
jgi:hypothetical protein